MARYTVELKTLLDSGYDIGLKAYPIFDEKYRGVLNSKIVDHFLFREIGAETPALFRHYLNRTLAEVMPLYNQLYLSERLTFDPLADSSLRETTNRTTEGSTTSTGTSATDATTDGEQFNNSAVHEDSLMVESDTPQGLLAASDILGNVYASKAARSDGGTTQSGTTTTKGTTGTTGSSEAETSGSTIEDYVRSVTGNSGARSFAELLQAYRDTFLNLDLKVIGELESCFMGVY